MLNSNPDLITCSAFVLFKILGALLWILQQSYLWAALLGMLLAAAELISRYRDTPLALTRMTATYGYLGFNALISISALYLIQTFEITGQASLAAETDLQSKVLNILLAGLGGAAFFRSSVARTKIGETEIDIGPSFLINSFLSAIDRHLDRHLASDRTRQIPSLMRKIPPDFAAASLTQYCIAAMQNLSATDEKTLETAVASILSKKLPSDMKSMLIGLAIAEHIGTALLAEAIATLKDEIEEAKEDVKQRRAIDEDELWKQMIKASETTVAPTPGKKTRSTPKRR